VSELQPVPALGYYPAQCSCGHLYLERYQFKVATEGNIGFVWCGFCRTRVNVKLHEDFKNEPGYAEARP
jgi:hypothetical protein